MRQTLSRGVFAVAATSILSLCGSPAFADAQTDGAALNVPDSLSGSNAQAPDETSESACDAVADATAGMSRAFGHACTNGWGETPGTGYGHEPKDGDGPEASTWAWAEDGDGPEASAQAWIEDGDGPKASATWAEDGDGPKASAQAWIEDGDGPKASATWAEDGDGPVPTWSAPHPCDGAVGAVAGTTAAVAGVCADDEGGYGDHGGYGDDGGHGDDGGYGDGGYGDDEVPPTHTPQPDDEEEPKPSEDDGQVPPANEEMPPAGDSPSLPRTGSGPVAGTAAASAALITGGIALYRRGRRVTSHG
ncbi:hypothetical protein SUDANB6_03874 [Streptomyces sp. enrichment culture]|uniref:hypothetical protein n=1 Tax=Streptomyces sp. enrichment culture TaxID=1795815 RepID=UPI003F550005